MSEFRSFQWANFARSTLASGISASDTSVAIQTGHGLLMPTVDPTYSEEIFSAILYSADLEDWEIVYCTNVVGDTLTIERGKELSVAKSFAAGSILVHTVTSAFMEQWEITPPSAPVLTAVKDGNDADLTWTASVPADAENPIDTYEIWRKIAPASTFTQIDTVDNLVLAYTDTDVFDGNNADTSYYINAVPVGGPTTVSNTELIPGLIPRLVTLSFNGFDTDKHGAYSDDGGDTWVAVEAPAGDWGDSIQRGCYSPELQLFLWVGSNGRCWTSPEGVTWTAQTTIDTSSDWNDVCWSPGLGLFVAVGQSGSERVMTSPDGITWTGRNSSDDGEFWSVVIWSEFHELLFAGNSLDAEPHMWSADGINWTNCNTLSNRGGNYMNVNPVTGVVLSATNGGSDHLSSPDGKTYTVESPPAFASGMICIVPNALGTIWFASAPSYNYTSIDDGENWTSQPSATGDWREGVCWDDENGRFVGLGQGTVNPAWSVDGEIWTDATTIPTGLAAESCKRCVAGFYLAP